MCELAFPSKETLPEHVALAAQCPTKAQAQEWGLVILAMQLPYWHLRTDDGHQLFVESQHLHGVLQELQAYQEEQDLWLPHQIDSSLTERPASFYLPYLACLLLITSFILQHAYAPHYADAGRMDALALISQNQWWRPLTALFLHADALHLLGNLVFGIWYGILVNRGFGTALGWSLILFGGVLGNSLTALLRYPDPHLSLGASTAVFAALGLLVAEGMIDRWNQRAIHKWGHLLIPFAAGGVLLGWTGGFGDPQTDGLAHAMGFLAGVLLGLPSAFILSIKKRNPT